MFNATATAGIYTYGHTLSRHYALPIYGRPHRRDQQGRAGRGRGQGHAEAPARQEAADPGAASAARAHPRRAVRAAARAVRRSPVAGLHLRHPDRGNRHRRPVAPAGHARHRLQGPQFQREFAGGDLRRPRARQERRPRMNWYVIRAIYRFEMARTFRTLTQSIASPVLSTSLYFVVFGAAIGSRMGEVDGVGYGAFIIPGLIMLSLLNESISNASFGIYMPKWAGTIYELLSAPGRSEEHTSELQSLMRISYAVFCLKKKKQQHKL